MAGRRRSILALCLLASSIVPPISATGSETVNYTYDARGRLVQVSRSGDVNDGVQATYSYDKADNRTNVTVVTSGGGGETPPSFAINNVSVTEGGNLVFTVTKTGTTSSSFSLNFATANGTAASGSDYTASSGTLTFAAPDVTKTITIATIDDAAVESNETVIVNLSSATGGATVSNAQGTGTINDNDSVAAVTFSVSSDGPVSEGAYSKFTVTKSGTATGSLTIDYATQDGTAVAPGDYTAKSGTLTFLKGATSKTVNVLTKTDALAEGAETLSLVLSNPAAGAAIGTGTASATINDVAPADCSGVSFTIASNGAVTEGTNSVLTVTKSGTTGSSCSVDYATANGTAAAPGDYTVASGTLTFTSAQTSKTVSIATVDDTTVESAETFTTNLSSPIGGATLGTPSSATATINDNDSATPPSFAVNSVSGNEGTTLTFTITKTGTVSGTYTVNYATANGNAYAGTNYYAKSGTLTFGPSDATKTVGVVTIHDPVDTPTKYFYLDLSSPSGGSTITASRGQGAIIDIDESDPCPTCLMAPVTPEAESTSDPASEGQEQVPPETSEPGQLSDSSMLQKGLE